MDLVVDFNCDLTDEKYNMFVDELYEDNYIENYIKKVLELEEVESDRPLYLSLLLTNNQNIQVINRDFRDKNTPTDVISFAYHETEDFNIGPYDTLGDIIISLERVEEQATEYNHSFKREFYYVLTHGILHILGYDHIEEEDKKIMREREEAILSTFGYTRDN
nr:rRNA maturation RNase YbeY [uncultured Fusobacterium sp.]